MRQSLHLHSVVLLLSSLPFLQGHVANDHSNTLKNANHIFNAIHSSMRQWGSSLNHNGMSFFIATVPQGTILHHGRDDAEAVQTLEWVAFEPSHALNFATLILAPPPLAGNLTRVKPMVPAEEHINSHQQQHIPQPHDQKPLTGRGPDGPLLMDIFWVFPGFLHTYAAKKDLRLLYIDGSSAAKGSLGTVDSTDILLLDVPYIGDRERARFLCDKAADQWNGRIDGFIRMEAGFEIILCSFPKALDLVDVQRTSTFNDLNRDRATFGEEAFNWLSAAASRYDGIGGSPPRATLDYSNFFTAYDYQVDLFQGGGLQMPRLKGTDGLNASLSQMRHDIDALILNTTASTSISTHNPSHPNWQAVADMLVVKYAKPLKYLATSPLFSMPNQTMATQNLWQALEPLVRIYLDTRNRNADAETHRCAIEYMPPSIATSLRRADYEIDYSVNNSSISDLPVAGKAIFHVAHRICKTLIDAFWHVEHVKQKASKTGPNIEQEEGKEKEKMEPDSNNPLNPNNRRTDSGNNEETTLSQTLESIRTLVSFLAWTEWKRCGAGSSSSGSSNGAGSGCAWDEICSVPMFPFGVKADHEVPRCRGRGDMEGLVGYWGGVW